MKIRILKPLPGIAAGTEIEQDELGLFSHNAQKISFAYIEQYPDFFEVIEEAPPVWDKKEWQVYNTACYIKIEQIKKLLNQAYHRGASNGHIHSLEYDQTKTFSNFYKSKEVQKEVYEIFNYMAKMAKKDD
jgi:hypothetical protein